MPPFLEPHPTAAPAPAGMTAWSAEPAAQHDIMQVRAAAYRARRVYPGPVGELLSRELEAVAEFGKRFESGTLTARLVAHIIACPLPDPSA